MAIMTNEPRTLKEIAKDIKKHWKPLPYTVANYVLAMTELTSLSDKVKFDIDDGRAVVTKFLLYAQNWRGEEARRIKNELKQMLKEK
jgi:hypothetical protein